MRYLFTSERLGFRGWVDSDLIQLTTLNNNKSVMNFFPRTTSTTENADFIIRMQHMLNEKCYCYFVVEDLINNDFLGFIGLSYQDYEASYNPSIDIGWRISPEFWGEGYATEGANRVLLYAKQELKLKEIVSVAPKINLASIRVMENIGMIHQFDFKHPKLKDNEAIEKCCLYSIEM